ncbi:MAG: hypothetical protein NC123_17715, partial [Butyrivibrio sp.]|nr:hypothetical protein [Butyrivibrio sp.]
LYIGKYLFTDPVLLKQVPEMEEGRSVRHLLREKNAVFADQKQMEQWTKEITNNTVINNIANNRSVRLPVKIDIGDIVIQGVQDVNGLAKAVKTHFSNAMLQEMYKKGSIKNTIKSRP